MPEKLTKAACLFFSANIAGLRGKCASNWLTVPPGG